MTGVSDWEVSRLVDRLVDGLTAENMERRIRLLSSKMSALTDEAELRWTIRDGTGSLDAYEVEDPTSTFSVYLSGLVRALRKAGELGAEPGDVSDWIDDLSPALRGRLKVWLLAGSAVERSELALAALGEAIRTRDPTGDDVRLLDELDRSEDSGAQKLMAELSAVLPPPPPARDLGSALGSNDVPAEWIRWWRWASVLGESNAPSWVKAKAILDSRYGPRDREHYRIPKPGFEFFTVGSPISEERLASLPPFDAAAEVAAWRPDPHDFKVSARELGRTLEREVATRTPDWAAAPVEIVAALHHPTFIAHYFQGLAHGEPSALADRGPEVVEAVELAGTHPWDVIRLGDDDFDYDPTWDQTDDAGVDLIRFLTRNEVGLGEKTDVAWEMTAAAVRRTDRTSGLLSPDRDPYESAINRPCTRALETMLHFVAFEHRLQGIVRNEAIETLDWVLTLGGRDGLEFRSVLGAKIHFLRYVAPEWVEARSATLFGDEAPDGLGRATLRSAVRWAQPNKWLLETYPEQIIRLATEGEGRALDHALIAMLWDEPGYESDHLYDRLAADATLLSQAGEGLARLLRPDEVSDDLIQKGIDFWEFVLGRDPEGAALSGFAWFTEVRRIPRGRWEELMYATVAKSGGRIDWAGQTAARALEPPATPLGLEIARLLLQGTEEPWEKAHIAETSRNVVQDQDPDLASTPEFGRLKSALIALGFG